jgi:hypothetical protein
METAISRMVDAYPRQPKSNAERYKWKKTFKDAIATLADEYFSGRSDPAVQFVEAELEKFKEHQASKGYNYAWAPERFFSDWVYESYGLKRIAKNMRQCEPESEPQPELQTVQTITEEDLD